MSITISLTPSTIKGSAGLGLALALCAPLAPALASPWGAITQPSSGAPQVIGATANGCIGGAEILPATGPGYVSVRRFRNRYYGHPNLLRFISDLGRAQQRRHDQLVMVGDLSQPRGGRMSSSHRSHQNGLDVDIWFTLAPSPAAANRLMDKTTDPPSMVRSDGLFVSERWGENQRLLIESAARHPAVDRIFVNAAIKRALCEETRGDRGWLRKVRPWRGHDAHFHVRLACPSDSPQCVMQDPLPPGDGCGADLAWWFSEEARKPSKGGAPTAPEPVMPAACQAVLRDF
ncbi:penicillin-insensitive murein endopeptidase [Thiobaca trueperi]|uniref:Murein endopeptidase n=1 Tax=Thiobaca trueperi TaxID=127458 RepID=A0A4R3MZ89_9GAMM|nr:penicillin-insensitive murein endopeptidase [Thiobaca trueperi]TCT21167.1 murein endopeptidase [Thiobaca trueperi]